MASERGQLGALKCTSFSCLAPMSASILLSKALRFRLRAECVSKLPIYKNYLIAASQKLKGPVYSVLVVELHRARFVEHLKIRWIDEVTHFDICDFEGYFFHWVGTLIRIQRTNLVFEL